MKILKKLTLLAAAIALTIAAVFGNFAFDAKYASAAGEPDYFTADLSVDGTTAETMVRKATLDGQPISVPDGAIVKNPKGNVVTMASSTTFIPTEVGYFSVSIDGSDKYTGFKILVEADKAQIKVPFDGATIPTYVAAGTEVIIPEAEVVVYDDEGNIDTDETTAIAAKYTVEPKVSGASGDVTLTTEGTGKNKVYKFNANISGSYLVRYTAKNVVTVGGKPLSVLSKDYKVIAQATFTDSEKPELNIANVPSEHNTNVKLTLPKASATDNWDTNIKFEISVTDPSGADVKAVDDTDEKNLELLTDKVEFDNNGNLSFYPTESKIYKVTYKATDDKGNFSEAVYSISVSDKKAPTIEVEDENKIASVWGKTVYKKGTVDDKEPLTGTDAHFFIPKATAWDNIALSAELSVARVQLKDHKGTIFFDTNVEEKKVANVASVSETADGYLFNINDYDMGSEDTAGTYTLYYRATDARNQESSLSYLIEFKNEFTDTEAPVITVTNMQDIIWVGDHFDEPVIEVTDEDSARTHLKKVYEFSEDNGTTWDDFNDLDAEFELKTENTKITLFELLEKDGYVDAKKAGLIRMTLNAEDQVGNEAKEQVKEIPIINDTVDGKIPVLSGSLRIYAADATTATPKNFKVGDKIRLTDDGLQDDGTIDTAKANPDPVTITAGEDGANRFIGYDITVLNASGKAVDTLVKTTYKNGDENNPAVLTIDVIEFTAKSKGKHTVTIRGMELSGASIIKTIELTIDEDRTSIVSPPSVNTTASVNSTIPTSMEVGQRYSLPNWAQHDNWDTVVEVTGGRYELKGNLFTPLEIGSYKYEVYYRSQTAPYRTSGVTGETITVTDTVRPEFRLLTETDLYKDKFNITKYNEDVTAAGSDNAALLAAARKHMVEIPQVSVIDAGSEVTVDVEVTQNNSKVNIETIQGFRFFRPTVDSIYKITYTAKDKAGPEANTFTLSVTCGDLVPPTISDVTVPTASVAQGATIKLSKMTVTDNVTSSSLITVTKTITTPSGTIDRTETVKEAGETDYTYDKPGVYKIRYVARDEAGNEAILEYEVTVTSKASGALSRQVIATIIFICVGVAFLAFLVYFYGFRTKKGATTQTTTTAKTTTAKTTTKA